MIPIAHRCQLLSLWWYFFVVASFFEVVKKHAGIMMSVVKATVNF